MFMKIGWHIPKSNGYLTCGLKQEQGGGGGRGEKALWPDVTWSWKCRGEKKKKKKRSTFFSHQRLMRTREKKSTLAHA